MEVTIPGVIRVCEVLNEVTFAICLSSLLTQELPTAKIRRAMRQEAIQLLEQLYEYNGVRIAVFSKILSCMILVSCSQTTIFLQGVIACSISTRKNMIWHQSCLYSTLAPTQTLQVIMNS